MRLVVADASAVAEFLFRSPRGAAFEALLRAGDVSLHVPALCDVEVTAVLRRALRTDLLHERRAMEALTDYLDLPLTRHGHTELLERDLMLRENFSAYDGVYVSLAERLGAGFLTGDRGLARATRTHTRVPVLE